MNKLKIASVFVLSSFLFSACGTTPTAKVTPTPTPKIIELSVAQKPYISLIPRADGHELKLKIDNIPSSIVSIEYELLYTAIDNNLEMEKGVGDTIKNITKNIERDLLLGTASCTNGCKYKYDSGITGGTLSLNFITDSGQVVTYQTPFVLETTADIKKDGGLSLSTENISIKGTATGSNYFILIKNFGVPIGSNAKSSLTVFSNEATNGKFSSISPTIYTKDSTSLTGDYLEK